MVEGFIKKGKTAQNSDGICSESGHKNGVKHICMCYTAVHRACSKECQHVKAFQALSRHN
eukprot:784839-Pelagomonas_calceolata.AAC.2